MTWIERKGSNNPGKIEKKKHNHFIQVQVQCSSKKDNPT